MIMMARAAAGSRLYKVDIWVNIHAVAVERHALSRLLDRLLYVQLYTDSDRSPHTHEQTVQVRLKAKRFKRAGMS